MTAHALLSASASPRWISCFGSVALTRDMPDETSAYADDGTRMHAAAAEMLLGTPCTYLLDDEETDIVQTYVDYVTREAAGHQLMVEQRVDYSEVIGVPDSFGTSDAIILAGDTIVICDLKTGRGVKVNAEENEQLQLYALGALETLDVLGSFTKAKLVIVQPRLGHISEWTQDIANLRVFGQHARAAAAKVIAMVEGRAELEFKPSEGACRFCKAKAVCPALLAHVQDAVGADFENLDEDEIKTSPMGMGSNSLSIAMQAVPLIEDWCKAVRAKVEAELLAGKPVAGYKLVQGRNGVRRWGDEAAVEKQLRNFLGAKAAFETSLISPAQAEKKMKANKDGWKKLQSLIVQKPGPPSVAPETDGRPAWSPADDFENLDKEK